MNTSEAKERLEKMQKIAAEIRKQVEPLELVLDAYRAEFIGLGMSIPKMFGPGGSMDLNFLFDMARKSSPVHTVMQNRKAEFSKVLAEARGTTPISSEPRAASVGRIAIARPNAKTILCGFDPATQFV